MLPRIKRVLSHLNPGEFRDSKERRRLKKLPAFVPGSTTLHGSLVSFVDPKLFLIGKTEIFDKRIYDFRTTSSAPVIIDCGANIGLSVLFFKKLYPNSRIIAFEPDPRIFQFLKGNIDSRHFSDVDLRNQAVWMNDGYVNFFVQGGLSGRISYQEDDALITVPCVRLREFLTSPVEFLKLDIEGAESDVILDCGDLLENVATMFVEYHSHESKPQTLSDILAVLKNAGFRYHIKEAFTSPHPFINHKTMLGMDLQLNIFCYRD